MTSTPKRSSRKETVTLTRRQIEQILIGEMGWEPIDVTAFWRCAKPFRTDEGQS